MSGSQGNDQGNTTYQSWQSIVQHNGDEYISCMVMFSSNDMMMIMMITLILCQYIIYSNDHGKEPAAVTFVHVSVVMRNIVNGNETAGRCIPTG